MQIEYSLVRFSQWQWDAPYHLMWNKILHSRWTVSDMGPGHVYSSCKWPHSWSDDPRGRIFLKVYSTRWCLKKITNVWQTKIKFTKKYFVFWISCYSHLFPVELIMNNHCSGNGLVLDRHNLNQWLQSSLMYIWVVWAPHAPCCYLLLGLLQALGDSKCHFL